MADPTIDFGMPGGPFLRLRNTSGSQDKELKLNDSGDITLDGVVIGTGKLDMVLSQEAADSSSIIFTSAHVTGNYDVYWLVGEGIVLATDQKDLYLRASTDGGSTLKAGASDYLYAGYSPRSSGASTLSNSAGAAFIKLNTIALSNVVAEGFGFNMYMKGAARAAAKTVFEGTVGGYDYVPRMNTGILGGTYDTAEVVNGLGIVPEVGNITRGRLTLYALKHT